MKRNITGNELEEEILKLENDDLIEVILINNYCVTTSFHFSHDIEKRIEFTDINFTSFISISNCTFKKYILISNIECLRSLKFQKTTHYGNLIFNSGKFEKNVDIFECQFYNDLKLYGGTFKNHLRVFNGTCHSGLFTEGKIQANEIQVQDTKIKYEMSFKNDGKIEYLNLSENDCGLTTFYSSNLGELEIDHCGEDQKIEIETSIIDKLKFSNLKNKGEILIKDSELNAVEVIDTVNYQNIKFLNIKVKKTKSKDFIIKNSDLGKAEFLNVDTTNYNNVIITDSILMNILPINFQIKTIKATDNWNLKETYRQLKYSYHKSGDNYNSMIFASMEMQTLNKIYSWNSKHFLDKFILWSRQSNNFDQNWLKPIILAFCFIFPIYFNILYQLKVPYVFSETLSIADLFGKFLLFLNPTHKPDFIDGYNINALNITIALDYISRLLSGYFLYQTIKAFRKLKE